MRVLLGWRQFHWMLGRGGACFTRALAPRIRRCGAYPRGRDLPRAWPFPYCSRVATDWIWLEGMVFYAYHGVDEAEKRLGQRFVVDLGVSLDLRPAGTTDDLSHTVNYARLYRLCQAVVEGPSVNLLETLAERIATEVLNAVEVDAVRVRVHKPEVPIRGSILRAARVEIERRPSPARGSRDGSGAHA